MQNELTISTGQYSDKGRKPENQDATGLRLPAPALKHIKGVALAMADGISSSQVSHIASETAVKSFLQDYYCTSEAWSVKTSAERVLNAVNAWLYSQTMAGPSRYDKDKGYVCTISTLIIKNHTAHIFHAGDTRVYRLNAKGLEKLTNDHRLWATPQSSYLSRALGIEAQCAFDYQAISVAQGDYFILATDGIYEFVNSQDIVRSIENNAADLNRAAKEIAELALAYGSDDNLSIQIARVDSLPDGSISDIKEQIALKPFPPLLTARMEFDGYLILRELHATNRSHVYLAQDISSGKKVVIKAPSTELGADATALERFLMEEWVARRINSAHVLKADLAERERAYIYTVFEYIEGQTLAQWARDNPRAELETVRGLVEQITKGLHAFHRMDMLHQDLRPENIMLDKTGTVKIIDFGSVSVAGLNETESETSQTYLLGTALYSAPEYFLGEAGTVQSELFSLGVITYFLLSGQYPYGTDVAKTKTLSAQRKLHYKSILDEERAIPAWVDDAIHKAVQALPERRYESLFEFVHDLRQPNKVFLNKSKPPLLERNPVAVWQGISFILLMVIVYLLNH
ncbi:MAG: bifunctional protein-serine/threonine kinase/phosphatase [Oceanospirillaceae bacterium]|nr:bifunctional protein-serine/threonine kinase/phosphatase [Oceanospirillaceae bacterium]